jgi:hypothetical protein
MYEARCRLRTWFAEPLAVVSTPRADCCDWSMRAGGVFIAAIRDLTHLYSVLSSSPIYHCYQSTDLAKRLDVAVRFIEYPIEREIAAYHGVREYSLSEKSLVQRNVIT